jgi:hypothetical protein
VGQNSGFYTSYGPFEGSMCPDRAGITPIGQQNQPGQLKLLVLRKKKTVLEARYLAPAGNSTF